MTSIIWNISASTPRYQISRVKENTAVFQKEGETYEFVQEALVNIPIELEDIRDHAKNMFDLCNHLDTIKDLNLTTKERRITDRLETYCLVENEDVQTKAKHLTSIYSEALTSKEKRFAGLAIASVATLVGGFVGGEINSLFHPNNEKYLHEMKLGLQRDEQATAALTRTVNYLAQRILNVTGEIELEILLEDLKTSLLQEKTYFDQRYNALQSAAQGKLTPDLLPFNNIQKLSHRLNKRYKEEGYKMLPLTAAEVYDLPCHLVANNHKRSELVLCVPLVHPQERMDIYRLRPTAVRIGGEIHVLDTKNELIAINQNRDRYRTIPAEEFLRCRHYGSQVHLCRHSNIVYKSKDECLFALYIGDDTHALKTCRLREVAEPLSVLQHSPSGFYVYARKPLSLIVKCGKNQHVEQIKGLVDLALHDCTASSDSFTVRGLPRLRPPAVTFNVTATWNASALRQTKEEQEDEKQTLSRAQGKTMMERMLSLEKIEETGRDTYHTITNHVQTSTIVLLSGAVIIIIFILYKARMRGKRALQSQDPGNNIVLNVLNNPADQGANNPGEEGPIAADNH